MTRRPASDFKRVVLPLCDAEDGQGHRCKLFPKHKGEHLSAHRWVDVETVRESDMGPFGDAGAAPV